MTLREVFERHGCDKAVHGYHAVYEKLPEPARMLEVGVYKGNSLRAWIDWWRNAVIWGMDTFERGPVEAPLRTRVIKADARTVIGRRIMPLGPDREPLLFDLIIDDGSHRPRDQAATLRNLWPLLAPGGRYFIEDVLLYDRPLTKWFQDRATHFNADAFEELWDTTLIAGAGAKVIIHDFRRQSSKPDSVLLEIRKP